MTPASSASRRTSVKTACQATCPADAITFGNLANDEERA